MKSSHPVSLAVLLIVAVGLTACAAGGPSSSESTPSHPSASASPKPTGSETDVPVPDTLGFDDGDDVDNRMQAQWIDAMIADKDFTLSSPDDGKGNWAYTQNATQCVVRFWQGSVADLPAASSDRELSDAILSVWTSVSPADVTAHAADGTVGYQLSGEATAAVRIIAGSAQDKTYVTAARGLRGLRGGFLTEVECPSGQSATAPFAALTPRYLGLTVYPAF